MDVYEAEDGTVSIRANGVELPGRAFQRNGLPRQQGAVVTNKLLSGVLDKIKQGQVIETQAKLAVARTRRERELLTEQLQQALRG